MRLSRFLVPLLAFSWIEACSVYHEGLLGGSDDDADSSGGKSSGGKPSSSSGGRGGDDDDSSSGGRTSGGASTGSGGGGATNTGGMPDMGGSNSGGATPDSGGAPSAGGMPAAGGDRGTGGGPPEGPFLLTDMSTHIISSNTFFGEIFRYNQEGTTWAAKTVAEMLEPRDASDEDDLALHVAATFDDDDWGIDIALTLKRGEPFDLSPYKKIIFEVKGAIRGTPLRVALEDYASHRDTDLCSKIGEGDDCDKHVEALSLIPVSSSWKVQEVDFSLFEGCGEGCTRKNPFDITRVYAIHFKMDPPEGEAVDFFLDNIYIDN